MFWLAVVLVQSFGGVGFQSSGAGDGQKRTVLLEVLLAGGGELEGSNLEAVTSYRQ